MVMLLLLTLTAALGPQSAVVGSGRTRAIRRRPLHRHLSRNLHAGRQLALFFPARRRQRELPHLSIAPIDERLERARAGRPRRRLLRSLSVDIARRPADGLQLLSADSGRIDGQAKRACVVSRTNRSRLEYSGLRLLGQPARALPLMDRDRLRRCVVFQADDAGLEEDGIVASAVDRIRLCERRSRTPTSNAGRAGART